MGAQRTIKRLAKFSSSVLQIKHDTRGTHLLAQMFSSHSELVIPKPVAFICSLSLGPIFLNLESLLRGQRNSQAVVLPAPETEDMVTSFRAFYICYTHTH